MMLFMLTAIIGIVFGSLCICLGRWVYRNSTKVLPTIIIFTGRTTSPAIPS